MMTSYLLATVLATAAPTPATLKIIGTSMFKNGYVFVMREMETPKSGEYFIKQIPQSSYGTLWFSSTDGIKVKEIVNTIEEGPEVTDDLDNLNEILVANKGKELQITVLEKQEKAVYAGKLILIGTDIIMLDDGKDQFSIKKAEIQYIRAAGKLITSRQLKTNSRGLRFVVDAPAPGKIYMASLEYGVSWVPAFAIDISDPEKLTLTGKATMINELEDIKNAEFRFVTGFPNLQFAGQSDPLTSNELLQSIANKSTGGLRGGGGGGNAEMMMQRAANNMPAGVAGDVMDMSGEGMQAGELFFYTKPNMSLKKGEKAMYMLFQNEMPYKEIFTWDVTSSVTEDNIYRPNLTDIGEVWQTIRFKNLSNQPLTTSAVSVFQKNQIIGQDSLAYTPMNGEAVVRITKSLDIRIGALEEETKREQNFVKRKQVVQGPNGPVQVDVPIYDRITVDGTLRITNLKNKEVTMKVTKTVEGEVVSSSDTPKITKTLAGIRDANPTSRLEWQITVKPGEVKQLKYQFNLLVKASGA